MLMIVSYPPNQQPWPPQGDPNQGQPQPGQPYAGPPYPGQPYAGQAYPGQPYPGQPSAGPQFQGPHPGQPYRGQQFGTPANPDAGTGLAIGSIAVSVVAVILMFADFISSMPALIVALGALFMGRQAQKQRGRPGGLPLAAIIVSTVALAIYLVVMLVTIAFGVGGLLELMRG